MKKKVNKQDLTTRNLKAAKKREAKLEDWVKYMFDTLNDRIDLVHLRLSELEHENYQQQEQLKKIKKG